MRHSTTGSALVLAVSAVVAIAPGAGAQSTSDKVGSTMNQTEDKAKSMGETVKTEVGDSWLTSKTKIALFADDRVKGRQITVDTANGAVHLRGKVDSADAKAAAGEIAKGIDGVKSVTNDLQVVAPERRSAVAANDKEITRQVEQRLDRDPQTKKIDVRTDAGVVTLTGEVSTIAACARASESARQVPGVRAVKNQLAYADKD